MMTAIALAQVATDAWRGRVGVLDAVARMADEAAGRGASLICFPEQFVTGWSPDVAPGAGEPLIMVALSILIVIGAAMLIHSSRSLETSPS